MLSRRRDLRRSLPVILSYQRISAKVLCIRESFMNPDVSYSGAFMLSTMLIFFTCRRGAMVRMNMSWSISTVRIMN